MEKRKLQAGTRAYASMPVTIKGIDKETYRLTMVASTQSVDRHGDTIMQDGWDIGPYAKNPVILNSHNYYDATEVIARAENTRIEGKGKRAKLVQEWVFAVNENPKAKIIFDLYAGGFLHASSVGFIPRKFAEKPDGTRDWFVIEEAELLEVSAVSVPANATATLAKSIGVSEADILSAIKTFDPEHGANPNAPLDNDEPEEDEEEDEEEDTPEPAAPVEPAPAATETPEEKRVRLEAQKAAIEAELKELTPEPEVVPAAPVVAKAVPSSVRVLKALSSIESDRTAALVDAQKAITKLLGVDASNLSPTVKEKVRNREYNKVIRNLIKAK